MKLYIVRHAQSVGNLTADYSTLAHDQLSPMGWEQAESLARRLSDGYHFDAIYSSPSQRALETISVFLKNTGRTAEVWMDLEEACWQIEEEQLIPPRKDFEPGRPIGFPETIQAYFELGNSSKVFPPLNEIYQEGLIRIRRCKEELLRRHGGTTDSVLVMGHGCAFSRLIDILLGNKPAWYMRYEMSNTGISCLEEHDKEPMCMRFFNRL